MEYDHADNFLLFRNETKKILVLFQIDLFKYLLRQETVNIVSLTFPKRKVG